MLSSPQKVKGYDYRYELKDSFNATQGIIDGIFYPSKEWIEIRYFCVAFRYRNSENKYGRILLNALIEEARCNTKIKKIMVLPKPSEEFDFVKPMERETLFKIYQRIGFEFLDEPFSYDYERKMVLCL